MHDCSCFCATAVFCTLVGCSNAPNLSTIAEERTHVSITRWAASTRAPEVVVLVVDDTQDPPGAALRESLASAAQLQDQPAEPTREACPGSLGDALVDHPMDVRFAVVHPSAISSERLVTPHEVRALARTGEINDPLAYAEWQSAIQSTIRATPTSNGTYGLIESVEDTLTLLTGQRSAATAQERDQLAALSLSTDASAGDRANYIIVNIATAHDDGAVLAISDDANPTQWLFNEDTDKPSIDLQLAAVNADGNLSTSVAERAAAYPRVAAWLKPVTNNYYPGLPLELSQLFHYPTWDSGKRPCMPARPRTLTDGSAACRIHSWLPTSETCDPSKGQLDPLVDGVTRAPQFTSMDDTTYRVCELHQFEGENLRACLADITLPNPEPGWCFPEASPRCSVYCPSTKPVAQNFRFVGGIASPNTGGIFEVTCELRE